MKIFVLSCFIPFIINGYSQNKVENNKCKIVVTINSFEKNKFQNAFLEIYKEQLDSSVHFALIKQIPIVKNIFSFEIDGTDPFGAYMQLKIKDSIYMKSFPIIISNERINVSMNYLTTDVIVVKSKQNDFLAENMNLLFEMPAIIVNEKNFSYKLIKISDEFEWPWQYGMLKYRLAEFQKNVIKQVKAYQEYYFALDRIYNNKENFTPKTLDTCYSIFSKRFKNSTKAKKLQQYIIQSKELKTGNKIPLFQMQDVNMKSVSWSESFYKNYDYTLIDFWASWCVGCREETKKVQKIYSNIDTSKFQIISVSIDEEPKKWITAFKADSIVWKNYIDTKGWNGNVAKAFNLFSIPRNIVIDKNGIIIEQNIWDKELSKFLQEKKLMKDK